MALINKLKAIGDAIRAKTGKTDELTLDQMVTEIEGISGGDGGDGWDYVAPSDVAVRIGYSVFKGSRNLKTVTIPRCDEIESDAFQNCVDLEYVEVGKAYANKIALGMRCFDGCESLEVATFGRCGYVGGSVFEGCTNLKKVCFESAEVIDLYAFGECSKLNAVIIGGETVCQVALNAFDYTPMTAGEGHVYVPTSMYESYRAGYEAALDQLMPGFFDILFRKIEDYPEICG